MKKQIMGSTLSVASLPNSYQRAKNGDFTTIAKALVDLMKRRKIGSVMTYLTSTASGLPSERMNKIREDLTISPYPDAMNYPFNRLDFQALLGSTPLPGSFAEAFQSEIPVLIVSGADEVRTSVDDAKLVTEQFVNSHHFIIPGLSHNHLSYLSGSIRAFFKDGTIPTELEPARQNLKPNFRLPEAEHQRRANHIFDIIESKGLAKGIEEIGVQNEENFFVIVYVAGTYLGDKKYEEAAEVYSLGCEFFPLSSFIRLLGAVSYSSIDHKVAQLAANRNKTEKKRPIDYIRKLETWTLILLIARWKSWQSTK